MTTPPKAETGKALTETVELSIGPADQIIAQIEALFPDWRSYRDLVDCIECTIHRLKENSHVR